MYTEKSTTRLWCNNNPDKAEQKLMDCVEHNMQSAYNLVEYVSTLPENMRMVRLGSNQIPMATEPTWRYVFEDKTVIKELEKGFAKVGQLARDKDDNLEQIHIADGTHATHAVTKGQLESAQGQKIRIKSTTVNYNSGTVAIGTASANTHIQKVVVEKGAGNWTSANATTEIIVGDAGDTDRLFSGFEPAGGQFIFENDHTYSSSTAISAIVTQGGAEAGSATVKVFYAGVIT